MIDGATVTDLMPLSGEIFRVGVWISYDTHYLSKVPCCNGSGGKGIAKNIYTSEHYFVHLGKYEFLCHVEN